MDSTIAPPITTFGEADPRALEQLERCRAIEDGARAVLCADNHVGYSQPIGGAVAYRDHISPSGVGYDIGCGNKAVRTGLRFDEIAADVPRIMDDIFARISFGMGRANDEPVDHPVLDAIFHADFVPQRKLYQSAGAQLGTVGAGNHYVDLFRDEDDNIWVGVHFGSRGFGHKTASGFLALAQGLDFTEHAAEGEMDSPPIVFPVASELGQSYIAAMTLAGEYAYAGRDVVVDKVLEILGTDAIEEVHNHHNFAWRETHDGSDWWVVRKGCTPAFPGQPGFVGATMAEQSVILEGVDSPASQAAFYSTVHGAGRVMSRTAAAGKSRKRWACQNRDCAWVQPPRTHKPEDGCCPECGNAKLSKRWVKETEGAIDWPATLADVESRSIELRGANAEEAPGAYKRLDAVLAAHAGTIQIKHLLTPIGVAMAPGDTGDTRDPYKD